MDDPDDIANLFKHFDGDPKGYQELTLSSDALHAKSRWPLLSAINPNAFMQPASVGSDRVGGPVAEGSLTVSEQGMLVETLVASAEKATAKAQFVAPKSKVLRAARANRSRDAARPEFDPTHSASAEPPDPTHSASAEPPLAPPVEVRTVETEAPPAKTRLATARAKKAVAAPVKRLRGKSVATDTAAPVGPEMAPPAAPPEKTTRATAERPAGKARFVAPKPRVLGVSATSRRRKTAETEDAPRAETNSASSAKARSAVTEGAAGPAGSNGTTPPSSPESTAPFLFKKLKLV